MGSDAGGGSRTRITVFLPAGTLKETLLLAESMSGVKSVVFIEAL